MWTIEKFKEVYNRYKASTLRKHSVKYGVIFLKKCRNFVH